MLRKITLIVAVAMSTFILALPAQSAIITFTTNLSGSQEFPPNASPAAGIGIVVLDDVADTIKIDLSWTGLTAPATAAHIQGPAPLGANAPVVFGFSGVPAATAGAIPEQTFSITPTQIVALEGGLYYFNVHDSNFPGGEIRGQIGVPEPGTLLLLGFGIIGVLGFKKRRSIQ